MTKRQEYLKDYYQRNKHKWTYTSTPTKVEKEYRKVSRMNWKQNNPEAYLLSCIKYRSKKENIPFNLEVSDIVIPEYCPYLNIKLISKKGIKHADNLMSVDRIIPELGYIKGNIEIISYKANRMKNNATIQELLTFSKNAIEKYKDIVS